MHAKNIAGLLAVLAAGAAVAQASPPPAALPGQIERQFAPEPQPRIRADEIRIPEPAQPLPPENAAAIRFRLQELSVDGATVYDQASLATIYAGRLGREVSLADVYAIAGELTARYRNDGYILSQVLVPAQVVESGRVRLQVVEGYVARVSIDGGDDSWRQLVRAYADKIQAARPLKASVLERYLLLMNDLPGAFARATLAASKTEQGAADLLVQFVQRPLSAELSVDDRGSKSLGSVRWTASLDLNSVLGLQEKTSVKSITTAEDRLRYLSIAHEQQLGSEGARLGLSLGAVRSKPDESSSFIPLNLQTRSDTAALTFSYPLLRSRSENVYVRAAYTELNGSTELFGFTDTTDRIRAVRLGATYDFSDRYRGINILDAEFSQGLHGFGASRAGDPDLSRPAGRPDFDKFNLYAARLQALAPRWSLLAAVSVQQAGTTLLAPELFGVGGDQFGRGYDPSELVGDNGAAAKLELRFTGTLPEGITFTAYGFYDTGYVRQREAAGQSASSKLTSAGLGLRAGFGRHASGFVELAQPLDREVAAFANRAARIFGGISLRY